MVGTLYLPLPASLHPSQQIDGRLPGVVVTGAWTTIKEQMAGRYAAELAQRGMVALAFDFRSWGQSEGATRSLENPRDKIADIHAAAHYLLSRDEVATVHGLGICASAGYMATAAMGDSPLTSLSLVAPWLHDRDIVEAVYGGADSVVQLIQTGQQAAELERQTGEPQLITAAGKPGSDALMPMEGYYLDPQRGLIDAWENTFNVASWEGWLTFDAQVAAAHIIVPTIIIHSEAAAIPQGVHQFIEQMTGPHEVVWLDHVGQFDFYDQQAPVTTAADQVVQHIAQAQQRAFHQLPQQEAIDRATISTKVELVANLVDAQDFDHLVTLFASSVTVDYSSLFGQPAELLMAKQLMQRWQSLLPGFDATRHSLGDIDISLSGNYAEVVVPVIGEHWLGEDYWRVEGYYRYQFARTLQGWNIISMTLQATSETGSRDIIAQAIKNSQ